MAMIEISPAGAPGATPPGALVLKNRFEPAAPLSGTILPSLLDETLLEAELSLAAYDGVEDFSGAVSRAAESAGGALLFEVPASGLLPGSRRVAVIALPSGSEWLMALACMDPDGSTIRIEQPDARSEAICQLARSFMGVLGRLEKPRLAERALAG